MRAEYMVSQNEELQVMESLRNTLLGAGINSKNTIIVTVSTDYSSVVGQYLRHQLTKDGEICDGFGIDVPYPDETWTDEYISRVQQMFRMFSCDVKDKTILLVEAGVIRGSNYKKVIEIIRQLAVDEPIATLAMFENVNSKFKSDFVGKYYNDDEEDLTFWWERYNKHWQ
jgi:hypothetical protein